MKSAEIITSHYYEYARIWIWPTVATCPLRLTCTIILHNFARCLTDCHRFSTSHVSCCMLTTPHIHLPFLSCFTRTFFSESWSPTRRTLAIRSASWRSPTAMLHQNPWSYESTVTRRGYLTLLFIMVSVELALDDGLTAASRMIAALIITVDIFQIGGVSFFFV